MVLLPEPVAPVTKTIPGGRRSFDDEAYFEVGDGLGTEENGYVAGEPGYDDFKEPSKDISSRIIRLFNFFLSLTPSSKFSSYSLR